MKEGSKEFTVHKLCFNSCGKKNSKRIISVLNLTRKLATANTICQESIMSDSLNFLQ